MSWTLPNELWSEVIYFLKIPEFISLTNVNKVFNSRWNAFYDNDYFWDKLLRNHLSKRVRIFEHKSTVNMKSNNHCLTVDFGKSVQTIKNQTHCDYIYKKVGYVLYKTIQDQKQNNCNNDILH